MALTLPVIIGNCFVPAIVKKMGHQKTLILSSILMLAGFLIGVLPAASGGAILMPWVVGIVSEKAGLAAGMASNIVPCVGLVLFTLLVARLPEE